MGQIWTWVRGESYGVQNVPLVPNNLPGNHIYAPPPAVIDRLNELINNYIKIGNHWTSGLHYLSKDEGGFGGIEVGNFITSIQTNFLIKSWLQPEPWVQILREKTILENIYFVHPNVADPNLSPIAHILSTAFNKIKTAFLKKRGNIWDCPIFYADPITDRRGNIITETSFLSLEKWNLIKHKAVSFTLDNLCIKTFYNSPSIPISKAALETFCEESFSLSNAEYTRFKNIIGYNIDKFSFSYRMKRESLGELIFKKGRSSKSLRKVLEFRGNLKNACYIKYYARICNENVTIGSGSKFFTQLWSNNLIDYDVANLHFLISKNRFKTFDRKSHYRVGINEGCPLCSTHGPHPAARDSMYHGFLLCKHINHLVNEYRYTIGINFNDYEFFTGVNRKSKKEMICINFDLCHIQYFILQVRIRKVIPRWKNLFNYLSYKRNKICKSSDKYKQAFIYFDNLCKENAISSGEEQLTLRVNEIAHDANKFCYL